jgi:hypothetical protein
MRAAWSIRKGTMAFGGIGGTDVAHKYECTSLYSDQQQPIIPTINVYPTVPPPHHGLPRYNPTAAAAARSYPDQHRSVPYFGRQPETNASESQILVSRDNLTTLQRALVSIEAPPVARKDRQRARY